MHVDSHSGGVRHGHALKYIYFSILVYLYSVLSFYQLLYFKIQKLVKTFMYYCICFYLAEFLVVTTCNIPIQRRIHNFGLGPNDVMGTWGAPNGV